MNLVSLRLILILGICFFSLPARSAEIKNTAVRSDKDKVTVTYDLETAATEADVSVLFSIKGKPDRRPGLHVSGDIGRVKPGAGRTIVWNLAQDVAKEQRGEVTAELAALETSVTDPLTGMEFVLVKGGCLGMGDQFGDGEDDERPVHEVCVADYYLGKYEVTQAQWRRVTGVNPSHFSRCGPNCPVESISWNDIRDYIRDINAGAGRRYRLPTEAEWEYAARSGGKKEKWAGTNKEDELGEYAWFDANSDERTHAVGGKKPNGLGMYDMSGNVWEWVQDRYDGSYYRSAAKDDPKGPARGEDHVLRGGSWDYFPWYCRTTYRYWDDPGMWYFVGFRLAFSPESR